MTHRTRTILRQSVLLAPVFCAGLWGVACFFHSVIDIPIGTSTYFHLSLTEGMAYVGVDEIYEDDEENASFQANCEVNTYNPPSLSYPLNLDPLFPGWRPFHIADESLSHASSWLDPRHLIALPLWIPFVISTGIATTIIVRGQQVPLNHCPHCRYNREGLPPNSPCPECGKPANPPTTIPVSQINQPSP